MAIKPNPAYLKAMSEYDIIKAAKADPDAPPLSDRQLTKFKRVNPSRITLKELKARGLA